MVRGQVRAGAVRVARASRALNYCLAFLNVVRNTTLIDRYRGFRNDCCMKYNNFSAYPLIHGEMLHFIQQSAIRPDITGRLLYFVQDFTTARIIHSLISCTNPIAPGNYPSGYSIRVNSTQSNSAQLFAQLHYSISFTIHLATLFAKLHYSLIVSNLAIFSQVRSTLAGPSASSCSRPEAPGTMPKIASIPSAYSVSIPSPM